MGITIAATTIGTIGAIVRWFAGTTTERRAGMYGRTTMCAPITGTGRTAITGGTTTNAAA